jgi:hypothetical protein
MTKANVDLEAEVARLGAIVDQLKGRLDGIDGRSNGHGGGEIQPHSRRDFVKLAGAAVAGAAGGVLLGNVPAAATNGQAVLLGNTGTTPATVNDAAATTSLTATTTTGPTPLVKIIGPGATMPPAFPNGPQLAGALQVFSKPGVTTGTPVPADGIDGWGPGGNGAGVIGASDTGYGVLGESGTGFDLTAFGTGRIFQLSITDSLGSPLAGPPTFAPGIPPNFPGGEIVRDANSVLWASRATAPPSPTTPVTYPKAWRRLNTTRFDSEDGSTVFQPVRIIDTRNPTTGIGGPPTGPRPANTMTTWGPFPGTNGIPSDALGIVGTVSVTGFSGQGFLAIFPTGANYNPASSPATMTYQTAWAWSNAFTIGFGAGTTNGISNVGKITIYTGFIATHVIVDVVAYVQ